MSNAHTPKPNAGATARSGSSLSSTGKLRILWRALAVTGITAIGALVAGFLWYAWLVPNQAIALKGVADGIVVLTGGADRIGDAVALLAEGHGRRLLISGVNRTTRPDEIAGLIPKYHAMFACCVDLDRSAANTIGNAVETRRWVHERGFRSLVVVTSGYHMPRAMAELAHQLPDVTLIPYPVVTERERAGPWWSTFASARRMLSEYVKYIVAIVRMHLDPPTTALVARFRQMTRAQFNRPENVPALDFESAFGRKTGVHFC